MVQLKNTLLGVALSTLLLLSVLTTTASASAGNVELEIDTDSKVTPRPKHADYACTIKSTSCKSTARFIDNVTYDPHVKLTTCHHDGFVRNWWNRLVFLSRGKGMFVNTFYVQDCDQKHAIRRKGAGQIRDVSSRQSPPALWVGETSVQNTLRLTLTAKFFFGGACRLDPGQSHQLSDRLQRLHPVL